MMELTILLHSGVSKVVINNGLVVKQNNITAAYNNAYFYL